MHFVICVTIVCELTYLSSQQCRTHQSCSTNGEPALELLLSPGTTKRYTRQLSLCSYYCGLFVYMYSPLVIVLTPRFSQVCPRVVYLPSQCSARRAWEREC